MAVISILLIAASPAPPSFAHQEQNNRFLAYQNPDYNLQIEYPANWTKSEINLKPYQIVFFYPPEVNRSGNLLESLLGLVILPVSFLIEVVPKNSTNINESASRIVSFLEGNNQSRLVDHNPTTLSGLPAYEVVYYAYTNDRTSKELDVWILYGNDSFVLLFNTEPGYFNHYLPVTKKMIDSFQIIRNDTVG